MSDQNESNQDKSPRDNGEPKRPSVGIPLALICYVLAATDAILGIVNAYASNTGRAYADALASVLLLVAAISFTLGARP